MKSPSVIRDRIDIESTRAKNYLANVISSRMSIISMPEAKESIENIFSIQINLIRDIVSRESEERLSNFFPFLALSITYSRVRSIFDNSMSPRGLTMTGERDRLLETITLILSEWKESVKSLPKSRTRFPLGRLSSLLRNYFKFILYRLANAAIYAYFLDSSATRLIIDSASDNPRALAGIEFTKSGNILIPVRSKVEFSLPPYYFGNTSLLVIPENDK